MRTIAKVHLLIIGLFMLPLSTFAEAAPGWVENSLYANGKINAVIAVIMIILVGILIWMFMLDKRLRKIEKE